MDMLLVQKLLWLRGIGISCDGSMESPSDCHRSACLTNLLLLAWNKFPHGTQQSMWVQLHCCTGNCSCWNLSMSLMKDFWGLIIFCYVFLPLLGLKTFHMFIEFFFELQNLVKSCVKCWWHQPYTFSEGSAFTLVPKDSEGTWVPLNYCTQESDSWASLDDL